MRDKRTAIILADGDEKRWSWELRGEPLVQRVHRTLEGFFDRVLVVTPDPAPFEEMGFETLADSFPDSARIGAITTGLKYIDSPYAFVTGADMPLLNLRIIRFLYSQRKGWDVVVPRSSMGFEPLCAVYSRSCVAVMEERISNGSFKILDLIADVRTRIVNGEDLRVLDPAELTFLNVNTKTDLDECRLHMARVRSYGPSAVSVVAKSGTGKTTMLEKIISELADRGYRVGTIKHDAHHFDIDHEGKDSWRLTQAGGSPMVISSSEKMAMVRSHLLGEMSVEEIIFRFMTDVDIVLTEGYKSGTLPKIEIHRAERSPELLCMTRVGTILDHRLIAVVSDEELSSPVPLFPLDHPGPICDFLEEQFLGGA